MRILIILLLLVLVYFLIKEMLTTEIIDLSATGEMTQENNEENKNKEDGNG